MIKRALAAFIAIQLFFATPAQAFWGGDVAVLLKILANAVQQLAQLRSIMQNGRDHLNLMRDINRGINDSLDLIRTIRPDIDAGIYKDWEKVSQALTELETIYGIVIDSRDTRVQRDTDQSIAEAVSFNNSIYRYTQEIDDIGERIKEQSHHVSPGGAAKLTAQSLGVMLHVQNEVLRAQATGLKLQAQALAIQNRKDKDRTRQMVASSDNLTSALKNQKPQFQLPRF